MRRSILKATFASTVAIGTMMLSVPALAQEDAASPAVEDGREDVGIVVTGSRIARPDLDSVMPVTVITMDLAERFGVTSPYDALIHTPSVTVGVGDGNSQGQAFDGGTASISMRNMGASRTLTLVDGRRRVAGSARASTVDLNMIPSGMIDRIEVVTGGAAAIYGADAVTGAVNIITKRNVDGIEIKAQQGISERGDAATFSVSASGGYQFAGGRGSLVVGGTYSTSDGLYSEDRKATRSRLVYQNNPANTGLNDGIPDRNIYYDWGEFYYNNYPTFVLNNVNYGYVDGGVRPLYIQTPLNSRGEFYGGDGGFVSDIRPLTEGDQLRAPNKRGAVISRLSYDFSDSFRSVTRFDYAESLYEGTKSFYREDSRANWLNGAGSAWAYLDNPYLPNSMRAFMVGNGLTRVRTSRAYKEFGQVQDVHDRTSFTVSQTFEGQFGAGFRWEAFGQYGRSIDNVSNPHTLRASRWVSARDVIADPVSGAPVCRDAAARAQGCVPYNIFSNDYPDAAQTAWMFADRHERRVNTQRVFGANVTGTMFTLPYGDVSFAVGAEHRRETLKTQEDPLATPNDLAHGAAITRHAEIDALRSVAEAYGEIVVPLLRGVDFAQRLEVEGAYRYSDYNTFGGTHTWKVGATWEPITGVSFRGVRSRSARVPNFGEMYEPIGTAFSNLSDPCENPYVHISATRTANCRALGIVTPGNNSVALTSVTSGGNPALKPEVSNSMTLGVVFQPRFLRGFDATIDYWSIDIADVITQFGAGLIAEYCVDLPTINNLFCSQMTRDPNDPVRAILTVSTQQLNASHLKARGVDVGMRFRTGLGAGTIMANLTGTYVIHKETEAVPGIVQSIVKQVDGFNDPRIRGTLSLSYALGGFSIGVNNRLIGATKWNVNAPSAESYEDNTVPARVYTDVSLSFDINKSYGFTIGVRNLGDKMPPYMPDTVAGAGGRYDVVGRSYFAGVKAKF